MATLRVFLFGTPRIERDGQAVSLPRSKAMALLAYLISSAQPHERGRLAALLWPELDEASARNGLRRELSLLRTVLGDDVLVADRRHVACNADLSIWSDVASLSEKIAQARSHGHLDGALCASCATTLTEAVALYTDDFLAGLTLPDCPVFDEWQYFQREALRGQVAEAFQWLGMWHQRVGASAPAIAVTRRWLQLDPLHEPAHQLLMKLYAWSGHHGAALRQYRECVRLLDAELAVPPEQATVELAETIRARRLAPPATDHATPVVASAGTASSPAAAPPVEGLPAYQGLPTPPAPLLGRATELANVRRYLELPHARLITLVGPGGIGKTRLAIELAERLGSTVADGVAFVALQPVASPDLLVASIADAVGCRLSGSAAPRVQLRNYLRERSLLLLLDNFEHLLAGAELLSELLAAAPKLRLLVTSREVLNLQEEWSYPLNGLPVPPEAEPLSSPEQYAAVALFAERTRRARPTFSLADEHAEVSRICRLVDGIPLAIELAAAWTTALGCRQIAIEIERSLAFLATRQRNAPERHRSMRAVFDSSWALLDQEHRACFSRLAIIRGGFTADAARHVADASPAGLATLVDKSLLQLEAGGRYQIHELLRQYAAEHLEAQPADAAHAREAHCDYYLAFLAERDEAVSSGRDVVRTAEIAAELENVRLAWQHAVARGEPQRIGRGINTLANFYLYRGPYEEGAVACEQVIQSLRRAPTSTQRELLLAEALHEQAWLYFNVGDLAAARSGLELTLQIYDHLGMAPPSRGRASHPWSGLALLALVEGDYAEAARLVAAYLRLSESDVYSGQRPFAWFLVARTALAQGLYARARHAAERAYVAVQAEGDRWFEAYVLLDLGQAMLALGQHHEARSHFQASYAIREAFGDPEGKALALYYEGKAVLLQGALPTAAELFARSLAIYQTRGDVRGIAEARMGQGMVSLALGEETTAAAYREALSLAWQTSLAPLILALLVCAGELLLARGRSRQAQELLVLVLRHPAADHETSARAQALLVVNEPLPSEPLLAAAGVLALPVLDDSVARTLAELAVLAQPQPTDPAAAPVFPPTSSSRG